METVEILWPSGQRVTLHNLAANHTYTIEAGSRTPPLPTVQALGREPGVGSRLPFAEPDGCKSHGVIQPLGATSSTGASRRPLPSGFNPSLVSLIHLTNPGLQICDPLVKRVQFRMLAKESPHIGVGRF